MIIDFHTHVFPDEMAEKTISFLADKSKIGVYGNGQLENLYKSMNESGVDISVMLPVVTSPKHQKKINDIAIENNRLSKIISFGGIHPDNLEYEEELERLKKNGIKGIKIHPDYQDCFIDDDRYVRVIEKAFSLGLIVITHSGLDYGFDCVHAPVSRVLNLLNKISNDGVLVLAHMGNINIWEEVIDKLCGKNVYFDLAFCLSEHYHKGKKIDPIPEDVLKEFIKRHGSDRILFATDNPWQPQKRAVEVLESYNISKEDKERIFYLNAKKILEI